MPEDLHITLIQADTVWHNPEKNRRQLEDMIGSSIHVARPDLVVLPEMFTTGFTMDAKAQAETMTGPSVVWMQNLAKELGATITGSLVIRDGSGIFNRLVWVTAEGQLETYDKRHLFRMAGEHHAYQEGTSRPIFALNGWQIRPIICYDLRFPVWNRTIDCDYDLLICPANWPQPRHNAWVDLLKARAIENQAFVAGVNRVGADEADKQYLGGSMIIDFKGQIMSDGGDLAGAISAKLGHEDLARFRDKFPVHLDADRFEILN